MARYKRAGTGLLMTKALGRMVGLLLGLYAFDNVITAVMPSVCSCPTTHTTLNQSTLGGTAVCYNSTFHTANANCGIFATTIAFVANIFPVIGILGAFEIIYGALRAAKLV